MNKVSPVPHGYHTITPYLAVEGAPKLLSFLRDAFDSAEIKKNTSPDGRICNAEIRVIDSMVMVAEKHPEHPATPANLYLYVADCDAVYARAVAAGGKPIMPPTDMFYGDRSGGVTDPCGNTWWIASRKEELTNEEITRRGAALGKI